MEASQKQKCCFPFGRTQELIHSWNMFISKQTLLKTYAGAIPKETGLRNLDAYPGGGGGGQSIPTRIRKMRRAHVCSESRDSPA